MGVRMGKGRRVGRSWVGREGGRGWDGRRDGLAAAFGAAWDLGTAGQGRAQTVIAARASGLVAVVGMLFLVTELFFLGWLSARR